MSRLPTGFPADDAETVAERIAAKRYGCVFPAFERLFALCTGSDGIGEDRLEVIHVEFRGMGAGRLLHQPDLAVLIRKDGILFHRPGGLDESESAAIEPEAFIKGRNVDQYRDSHMSKSAGVEARTIYAEKYTDEQECAASPASCDRWQYSSTFCLYARIFGGTGK